MRRYQCGRSGNEPGNRGGDGKASQGILHRILSPFNIGACKSASSISSD
jgi:hypothetical protein